MEAGSIPVQEQADEEAPSPSKSKLKSWSSFEEMVEARPSLGKRPSFDQDADVSCIQRTCPNPWVYPYFTPRASSHFLGAREVRRELRKVRGQTLYDDYILDLLSGRRYWSGNYDEDERLYLRTDHHCVSICYHPRGHPFNSTDRLVKEFSRMGFCFYLAVVLNVHKNIFDIDQRLHICWYLSLLGLVGIPTSLYGKLVKKVAHLLYKCSHTFRKKNVFEHGSEHDIGQRFTNCQRGIYDLQSVIFTCLLFLGLMWFVLGDKKLYLYIKFGDGTLQYSNVLVDWLVGRVAAYLIWKFIHLPEFWLHWFKERSGEVVALDTFLENAQLEKLLAISDLEAGREPVVVGPAAVSTAAQVSLREATSATAELQALVRQRVIAGEAFARTHAARDADPSAELGERRVRGPGMLLQSDVDRTCREDEHALAGAPEKEMSCIYRAGYRLLLFYTTDQSAPGNANQSGAHSVSPLNSPTNSVMTNGTNVTSATECSGDAQEEEEDREWGLCRWYNTGHWKMTAEELVVEGERVKARVRAADLIRDSAGDTRSAWARVHHLEGTIEDACEGTIEDACEEQAKRRFVDGRPIVVTEPMTIHGSDDSGVSGLGAALTMAGMVEEAMRLRLALSHLSSDTDEDDEDDEDEDDEDEDDEDDEDEDQSLPTATPRAAGPSETANDAVTAEEAEAALGTFNPISPAAGAPLKQHWQTHPGGTHGTSAGAGAGASKERMKRIDTPLMKRIDTPLRQRRQRLRLLIAQGAANPDIEVDLGELSALGAYARVGAKRDGIYGNERPSYGQFTSFCSQGLVACYSKLTNNCVAIFDSCDVPADGQLPGSQAGGSCAQRFWHWCCLWYQYGGDQTSATASNRNGAKSASHEFDGVSMIGQRLGGELDESGQSGQASPAPPQRIQRGGVLRGHRVHELRPTMRFRDMYPRGFHRDPKLNFLDSYSMPHTITPREACTKSFVAVWIIILITLVVSVGVPFVWMHRDYRNWVPEGSHPDVGA
jgi:hypothetical protein